MRLFDFTFIDAVGDIIILEHLGMLHKNNYRLDWEAKKLFYEKNGIREGENLFITKDDENGAIDAKWISDNVIQKIKVLVL